MPESTYISTSDVARRLGVDRSTVVRRVAAEQLTPAVVVPGYRGAFLFDAAQFPELEDES